MDKGAAAYAVYDELLGASLPSLRQSMHKAVVVRGANLCYTQGALR